jgi:eukaryotic-like serine/threonine-protein kinase
MTQLLRCQHGHSWETSAEPASDGDSLACPFCGDEPIGTQTDYPETIAAPVDAELQSRLPQTRQPPPHHQGEVADREPSVTVVKVDSESDEPGPLTKAAGTQSAGADRDSLQQIALATIAPTAEEADTTAWRAVVPDVPGYEIQCELGRGGMGVVYKARQISLDRLVALKMILGGAHAGSAELLRFRTEAEAVARLKHPNIVQIFEVGTQGSFPYCTLEYVDGGTLARKTAGTPQLPRYAARLTEILASAIHAAHLRGIVHRDLKPANILLEPVSIGTAGDSRGAASAFDPDCWVPKITDFGLAKRLDVDSSQTQSGTLLGTPSYMAPEQADGQGRPITPATDIYALGAILYELLTGGPPFRGTSLLETIMQVVDQEPVPPRRLQPKIPKDLETICLKCLEKDPRKRYSTGELLGQDLHLFLANRPIQARPVGGAERAWKWSRRRPAAAALIVTGTLALLTASVGGYWLAGHERALRKELERKTDEAVRERNHADTQERQAAKNYQLARNAVDQMLTRIGQDRLASEPHMEEVRRDLLGQALSFYNQFLEEKSTDPETIAGTAQASSRVGDIQELLGKPREAERAYSNAIDLFGQLKTPSPRDRYDLAGAYNNLGILYHSEGQRLRAEKALHEALIIKQALTREFPDHVDFGWSLAKTLNNWANFLQTGNRLVEAQNAYQDGIAQLSKLLAGSPKEAAYQQELAVCRLNLGTLLMFAGHGDQADAEFQTALDIQSKLVERFPNHPEYQKEQARIFLSQAVKAQLAGDGGKARAGYDRAAAILARLSDKYPLTTEYRHELSKVKRNLGNLLRDAGPTAEAEHQYQDAIRMLTRLTEETPDVPIHRLELSRTQNELALLCAQGKRPADAQSHWNEALGIDEKLISQFPDDPVYQRELAEVEGNLGILMTQQRRWPEARSAYGKAISVLEQFEAQYPTAAAAWRVPFGRDLVKHRGNLGNLLVALGQSRSAEKTWQRALDGLDELIELGDIDESESSIIEVVDMAPTDLCPLRRLAALLARLASMVQQQAQLPPRRKQELNNAYTSRAVGFLRQGIARGTIEPATLDDHAFDALRADNGFQSLVAEAKGKHP